MKILSSITHCTPNDNFLRNHRNILRKHVLTGFCYFFCLSILAQTTELDSLKGIIHSDAEDSIRLEVYDLLVKKESFKHPDSALVLATDGLKLAFDARDTVIAASITLNKGSAFYAKGDYEQALIFWREALELSEATKEQLIKPLAMNNVAVILQNSGKIDEAITMYQEALLFNQQRKDTVRVGRSTFNLGKAYVAKGMDSVGLHYISKSISVYNQLRDIPFKNLGNAYNEIGAVHYYNGDYQEALSNYQTSIRYYREGMDTVAALKPMGNIANIHKELGDLDEHEKMHRSIIDIKRKHRQFSVHYNYHNLGEVLSNKGNCEEAIAWFRLAINERKKAGLSGLIATSAYNLAGCFKHLDRLDSAGYYYVMAYENVKDLDEVEFKTETICAYGGWLVYNGNEHEALPLIEQCFELANEIGYKKMVSQSAEWISDIYANMGAFQKAYEYRRVVDNVRDSLFNADLIREITRKDAEFASEREILKRQNEIELLQSRESISELKIALLSVGIILVCFIAVVVGWVIITRKERKQKQLKQIAEFKEAMTGMIAHDLKTPLSIIRNSSDKQTSQMTEQMLSLINNMLDVHRFETTEVQLKREQFSLIELLNGQKEQLNHLLVDKNLQLNLPNEDFVILADRAILQRVFTNLLTNAIKYSAFNESIEISATHNESIVYIAVNNKGGVIPDAVKSIIFESFGQFDPKDSGGINSTGLGLSFVRLALKAHQTEIQLQSNAIEGTTFSFQLPLGDSKLVKSTKTEDVNRNLTSAEKEQLRPMINQLQDLKLHQAFEMEELLSTVKGESETIDAWVEAVLTAAYAGNSERWVELISEMSTK